MAQDGQERDVAEATPTAAGAGGAAAPERKRGLGLSAKLLILTALFVMLAEVLIFLPSVANFRVGWLADRVMAARLASLATEGMPDGSVPPNLRQALLNMAQVQAVAIKRDNRRRIVLEPNAALEIEETYDIRMADRGSFLETFGARLGLISDALAVYLLPQERMIRIIGKPPEGLEAGLAPVEFVEIVIPESLLRKAMVGYGINILLLSIAISLIAAALVYLSLNQLLVRPIMRITENMLSFSSRPEDASRIIVPSARTDEIGTAERELAHMQAQLAQTLHQKTRLAQLGLAVSKINHDLRNMLASAQLISDRLTSIPDPTVQRFAPKLIASLGRAIAFCNDTVRFGRAEEAAPRRAMIPIEALAHDVGDGLGLPRERIAWRIDAAEDLRVDADRDQLYRVLNNVVRNAVHAIEAHDQPHAEILFTARREGRSVAIEIQDTGPGLPARARAKLFQAFQGGASRGGTGLGLAIAAEIVAAHGGEIRLLDVPRGAAFRIEIPDRDAGR